MRMGERSVQSKPAAFIKLVCPSSQSEDFSTQGCSESGNMPESLSGSLKQS
jgi:hypothetical protein